MLRESESHPQPSESHFFHQIHAPDHFQLYTRVSSAGAPAKIKSGPALLIQQRPIWLMWAHLLFFWLGVCQTRLRRDVQICISGAPFSDLLLRCPISHFLLWFPYPPLRYLASPVCAHMRVISQFGRCRIHATRMRIACRF